MEQTFSTTLPKVYDHLKKRAHFCDYLMLTGLFNKPELDIEHRALYERILNQYLQRNEQRMLYGYYGNPNLGTQYSDSLLGRDQFS